MNETEKPHNPPSGPGACRACAGYRFAVEEAVHVLAIHHHHPWEKAVDVSVALSWLRNALADLYADGPPNNAAEGRGSEPSPPTTCSAVRGLIDPETDIARDCDTGDWVKELEGRKL